jgi:hypothetical protein
LAGSANTPIAPDLKPRRLRSVPWRDILIANGFVSLLLGLAALFIAGQYSADAHRWVQESSADEFARVVRLAVLLYVLYALIMLGAGMVWVAISVYSSRQRGVLGSPVIAPDTKLGATPDTSA